MRCTNHSIRRSVFGAVLAIVISLACPASVLAQATLQPVSIVITGGIVVTMNAQYQVLWPGAVAIDGQKIVAVDTPENIARRYRGAQVIQAGGHVVMPGLINTHTHAAMVMYRGLADDLALREWLQKYIFPAEAKTVSPELVRVGTRLAALEMIESGTTLFTDMYYFEEEVGRVARAAGLRGVLGETVIGFPVADAKTPADALARAERFIQEFKGDSLVIPAVAPHAMYTNDTATLIAARDLARKYGVPLLTHVAETQDEIKTSNDKYKMSPVAYLDSIGFWGPATLAAHFVHVSDEDLAIVRKRGAGLSHNPESNMKLASGTAPVSKALQAGIHVGLGTDGAASNNDLDMFEAMRQAAFLHKLVENDPTTMSARTALEMATIGGARALGMADRIGSIEPGKLADVIVVSMQSARQTPLYNPISHLVYVTRGDDVRTAIVNGRILMRNRRVLTLNAPAVIADAAALARKVKAAVETAAQSITPR
jgi:5-methylthioadenosine/S-adenosylhomocysteine deaminase